MPLLAGAAAAGDMHGGGVYFITPCHATPFYSHMHRRDVHMQILACPPMPPPHLDESERFLLHPGRFLEARYRRGWADDTGSLMSASAWSTALGRREVEVARATALNVPSHVVMFNGTYAAPGVSDWLHSWGFTRRADLFHAHFKVDRELQARVWVYARPRPGDFDAAGAAGELEEAQAIAAAALRRAAAANPRGRARGGETSDAPAAAAAAGEGEEEEYGIEWVRAEVPGIGGRGDRSSEGGKDEL